MRIAGPANDSVPELLLRCDTCGLVYVDEDVRVNRPFSAAGSASGEDLKSEWSRQFPDALDVQGEGAWGAAHQNAQDVASWQAEAVQAALGADLGRPGFTLVELGAARGNLLTELVRRYPSARIIGVEPSPVMAQFARASGAEIINGVIESASLAPGSVDAVVAFGCFIQIRDPRSALACLREIIRPGGMLLLDAPNNDSLMRLIARGLHRARRFGVSSLADRILPRAYNPGRFYYYTPRTLGRLLTEEGFQVQKVRMRQPRYLHYGRARLSHAVRLTAAAVSGVERVLGRQNWIELTSIRA